MINWINVSFKCSESQDVGDSCHHWLDPQAESLLSLNKDKLTQTEAVHQHVQL